MTYKVLGVLNEKGRLGLLGEISRAFDLLLDEKWNKVDVDVYVAQPLEGWQFDQVRQRVSDALGKEAIIHQHVDESIIGGLVLKVKDKLIDVSVKSQLSAIRTKLLAGRQRAVRAASDV